MPPSAVRPYTPADRAAALRLLGDVRPVGTSPAFRPAVDDPHHRVHFADSGAGVAVWAQPAAGELAYLGPVVTDPPDRRLFYQLVRACALDAISRGFRRATFEVRNRGLLTRIRRDFTVTAVVIGRHGVTRTPTVWHVEVDLADALRQLENVLRD